MALPTTGAPAPAFTLQDHTGTEISLSDYQGEKNVLVYFYPKAMTPGCTVQAQGLRDIAEQLTAHDVVVFGVSPDPVKRLAKFVERDALNFQLLSDEDHSVADAYGAWGPKKFMGKEFDGILRTSYLVDKAGNLCEIINKFKTKDHHEVVLNTLQELGL